jgi:hypothetical protein
MVTVQHGRLHASSRLSRPLPMRQSGTRAMGMTVRGASSLATCWIGLQYNPASTDKGLLFSEEGPSAQPVRSYLHYAIMGKWLFLDRGDLPAGGQRFWRCQSPKNNLAAKKVALDQLIVFPRASNLPLNTRGKQCPGAFRSRPRYQTVASFTQLSFTSAVPGLTCRSHWYCSYCCVLGCWLLCFARR